MIKRSALTLLSLLILAAPAQALKVIVWDGELQTKLGAGESSGSKFSVQLVKDYSGPVKVLFSQSAEEKARGTFNGLLNSYDGTLKNGVLTLVVPDPEAKTATQGSTPATTPAPAPAPNNQTFSKFLQQFKLTVSVQTTSQSNTVFNIMSRLP